MIIHLDPTLAADKAEALAARHQAIFFTQEDAHVLVLPSKVQEAPAELAEIATLVVSVPNDLQLGSRAYRDETRTVRWGEGERVTVSDRAVECSREPYALPRPRQTDPG